jgi:tripeptidyl-peptidase I
MFLRPAIVVSFLASKMFAFQFVFHYLSFLTFVQAAVASDAFESIRQLPRGWSFDGKASGDQPIKLRLSLKQQNVDQFYEKLLEVSTPDHPQYGMHYEKHELRSLLQPTQEASNAAISWLQENNITEIKDDGDYILFGTDVYTANRMLKTQFGWYHSRHSKHRVLRTTQYWVPEEVREHINFVQPTTRFGDIKPLSSMARLLDEGVKSDGQSKWWGKPAPRVNIKCNTTTTPECLLSLYNVHYDADPDNGNSVGYASFLEEYARFDDLAEFEKVYAPYAAKQNVSTPFSKRNELAKQTTVYSCTIPRRT